MPAEQIPPPEDPRKDLPPEACGPDLDREAILSADDRPVQAVHVPEWGGVVHVRTISGYDRDQFELHLLRHRDQESGELRDCTIRAALVAMCCCDSEGELLFEPGDVDKLGRKSAAALDRVYTVARRLNAFDQQDIDELKKASGAGPRASSPSGSAGTSEDGAAPTSA